MLLNKNREQYIDDLIAEGKTDEEILKLLEEFDVEPEPVDLGLGKPTDPVNVEANAGSENMASKSDTGSSELVDPDDFKNTQEEETALEKAFGKGVATDFFGDLSRSFSSGKTQGYSLD